MLSISFFLFETILYALNNPSDDTICNKDALKSKHMKFNKKSAGTQDQNSPRYCLDVVSATMRQVTIVEETFLIVSQTTHCNNVAILSKQSGPNFSPPNMEEQSSCPVCGLLSHTWKENENCKFYAENERKFLKTHIE